MNPRCLVFHLLLANPKRRGGTCVFPIDKKLLFKKGLGCRLITLEWVYLNLGKKSLGSCYTCIYFFENQKPFDLLCGLTKNSQRFAFSGKKNFSQKTGRWGLRFNTQMKVSARSHGGYFKFRPKNLFQKGGSFSQKKSQLRCGVFFLWGGCCGMPGL